VTARTQVAPRKAAALKGKDASARGLILRAALKEFSEEGFAGARTDRIAKAAGVNIALLFYYFTSKDRLYGAALEQIFTDWSRAVTPALEGKGSARERILDYVFAYFTYISGFPTRPRLVQQEMMRRGRSGSPHIRRLAALYIKPVYDKLLGILKQGIAEGVVRPYDPQQVVYSLVGIINFYFASCPVIEILSGSDPLSRRNIETRKNEVVRFVTHALFTDSKN
jgi:TetR/AcrR family transcriptional regulator